MLLHTHVTTYGITFQPPVLLRFRFAKRSGGKVVCTVSNKEATAISSSLEVLTSNVILVEDFATVILPLAVSGVASMSQDLPPESSNSSMTTAQPMTWNKKVGHCAPNKSARYVVHSSRAPF